MTRPEEAAVAARLWMAGSIDRGLVFLSSHFAEGFPRIVSSQLPQSGWGILKPSLPGGGGGLGQGHTVAGEGATGLETQAGRVPVPSLWPRESFRQRWMFLVPLGPTGLD